MEFDEWEFGSHWNFQNKATKYNGQIPQLIMCISTCTPWIGITSDARHKGIN